MADAAVDAMRARVEAVLAEKIAALTAAPCPATLAQAIQGSISGGGRVRAIAGLMVAEACGNARPAAAILATSAVEILHCASLVQDDLPCFDDAELRRGHPSVHRRFGVPCAILASDALIGLAYCCARDAAALAGDEIFMEFSRALLPPCGAIAGQAMELEPAPALEDYHRAKSGALFEAAVVCGAISGGGAAMQWRGVGMQLGAVYQLLDDLSDEGGRGKDSGQDRRHLRPSALTRLRSRNVAAEYLADATRKLDAMIPQDDATRRLRTWLTAKLGLRLTIAC